MESLLDSLDVWPNRWSSNCKYFHTKNAALGDRERVMAKESKEESSFFIIRWITFRFLFFCYRLRSLRATSKDVEECLELLITLYLPFSCSSSSLFCASTKCQFFGLSLSPSLFVCYYLHFGFINVFAYFYWLLFSYGKLFWLSSRPLSRYFSLMMPSVSVNLKQVREACE